MSEPAFYTVSELAALLRVKDSKIHAWIASGELAAFNVATKRGCKPRWRISHEAFTAFQAARAAVPKPAPSARSTRQVGLPLTRKWIK